jgi:hypothetical protein
MRKNPRRILSPQRLPFRHPGTGDTNLTKPFTGCKKSSGLLQKSRAYSPLRMSPGVAVEGYDEGAIAENNSCETVKKEARQSRLCYSR